MSRMHRRQNTTAITFRALSLTCKIDTCIQVCRDAKTLLSHLKGHITEGKRVTCPFVACKRSFTNKSTFASHVSRCHGRSFWADVAGTDIESVPTVQQDEGCALETESRSAQSPCSAVQSTSSETNLSDGLPIEGCSTAHEKSEQGITDYQEGHGHQRSQIVDAVGRFYLRLLSECLLPSRTVQLISEALFDLQSNNLDLMVDAVRQKLQEDGLNQDAAKAVISKMLESDVLTGLHNSSGIFRTSYTRTGYFQKSFSYVEPVAILLGQNRKKQAAHFHYVPLIETLKVLLKDKSVKQQFMTPDVSQPGVYKDFTDGTVFKSIPLFHDHPDALQLLLFQDAFEVVNPLGSAKKKHKILAVYMLLGNLYPWNRSRMHSIQLLLLCKEGDFSFFGQDKVFAPLIGDIRKLEAGCVMVEGDTPIFGTVVAILGDNLGSHTVGGFTENFSKASYICRFCLTKREKMFDKESLTGHLELRDPVNYNEAVKTLAVDNSLAACQGIKCDSEFNRLKYFHVCAPGLPPCLGHDLFEGVVSYDLALYLNYIIKQCRWLSVEELNKRILLFKFKGADANDRPPDFSCGKKLSGHAVQNWNLLRFLPLFIFEKVCVDEPVWELVLMLIEIVQLVCAPQITMPMIMRLKDLVEDYLSQRIDLFPDAPLRPKHHYLLHYPYLITQFGPLIRLWTMRCESKHSFFRRCLRNAQNFKNVTLTLTEKHQLLQAYRSSSQLYQEQFIFESSFVFCPSLFSSDIQKAISEFGFQKEEVYCSYRTEYRGITYRKDMVLVLARNDSRLVFGHILFILLQDTTVCFLLRVMQSVVEPMTSVYNLLNKQSGPLKCVSLHNVLDWYPLEPYARTWSQYPVVVLKHSILDIV